MRAAADEARAAVSETAQRGQRPPGGAAGRARGQVPTAGAAVAASVRRRPAATGLPRVIQPADVQGHAGPPGALKVRMIALTARKVALVASEPAGSVCAVLVVPPWWRAAAEPAAGAVRRSPRPRRRARPDAAGRGLAPAPSGAGGWVGPPSPRAGWCPRRRQATASVLSASTARTRPGRPTRRDGGRRTLLDRRRGRRRDQARVASTVTVRPTSGPPSRPRTDHGGCQAPG